MTLTLDVTGPNGLIPLPDGMRPPYSGHHGNSSVDNPCRECGVRRVGLKPPNATCFTCGVEAKLPVTGLHSLPNQIFANSQVCTVLVILRIFLFVNFGIMSVIIMRLVMLQFIVLIKQKQINVLINLNQEFYNCFHKIMCQVI